MNAARGYALPPSLLVNRLSHRFSAAKAELRCMLYFAKRNTRPFSATSVAVDHIFAKTVQKEHYMAKRKLNVEHLRRQAKAFSKIESSHDEPSLFGITDGKAVGTYLEHKFQKHLHLKYSYVEGSSAKGIDFPELGVDMKVTSVRQPQSSCPFKSARQKIFGLGYSLLVFVYEKTDNEQERTSRLNILHAIFVDAHRTGDFQTTSGLLKILGNEGNHDDIRAFFEERMLPLDDIQAQRLAEEVIASPPDLGYLTISNALQWRLQYSRVIQEAGNVNGIHRVL